MGNWAAERLVLRGGDQAVIHGSNAKHLKVGKNTPALS
jgi:hypothetical protein